MNAPLLKQRINIREANINDPLELTRIDAWLMQRDDSSPFHRPHWVITAAEATGQSALYLLAENSAGDLIGLLPLHIIHSPIFGRALVSTGFSVTGGVISSHDNAAQLLTQMAWKYAQRHSCPTLELRGGILPHADKDWQIKQGAHANFARPLSQDDEAELLAIPRKQRAEVRKGLKNELEVFIGRDRRDIDWHYEIYAQSVHNLGTPVYPKALIENIFNAFDGDADILTVCHKGAPLASVLSLYHKGTVMPYWGGGTWQARHLRANDIMYYALMNHARQRGALHFDFGRSKVGSGAFAFKKNWGFEPEPLSYAVRTADNSEARDINPNSPKYKLQISLWQKLPLKIANKLGPWIAKGLG